MGFFTADYASIERRLLASGECKLCECGAPLQEVVHTPTVQRTQFRFPRSKKARIRKKWAKNPDNYISNVVILRMGRSQMERVMAKVSTFVKFYGSDS